MTPYSSTTTDGESNNDHPAADVDTIVVDPDDVIEAMRRNNRDRDQQRDHVLRISPPFDGQKEATPHISQAHAYYPPELSQKPIHISPSAFIVGHTAGNRHSDWRKTWSYPNRSLQRSIFRDEFGILADDGGDRQLTDEEQDKWDEWWETVVERWEDRARHALTKTEELTLTHPHPDVEKTVVAVRPKDNNGE